MNFLGLNCLFRASDVSVKAP